MTGFSLIVIYLRLDGTEGHYPSPETLKPERELAGIAGQQMMLKLCGE